MKPKKEAIFIALLVLLVFMAVPGSAQEKSHTDLAKYRTTPTSASGQMTKLRIF
jgi:hypothetical protein